MEHIRYPSSKQLVLFLGLSLGLHLCSLVILGKLSTGQSKPKVAQRVTVNVVERPKAIETPRPIAEPAPAAPPPPPPRTEARPTPPRPRPTTTAASPAPAAQPVLGLNPDSFAQEGTGGFSAPVGNTTDVRDEGKRLSPEEIKGLPQDLSQDAQLILNSFVRPTYTTEAEDAGLEGSFVIEVYVDPDGRVTEAELATKIGFGMDGRVLEAARNARFSPRKDALGRSIPGWTQIRVRLTID